ncbi:unnamed protein product [Brassica oleracea]
MLRYARSDTQYLLEITNVLTAELKEGKKYDEAIMRSNKMCLTLYTKGQEDFKLVKTGNLPILEIHRLGSESIKRWRRGAYTNKTWALFGV